MLNVEGIANLHDVSANHMNLAGTITGHNANLNDVSVNHMNLTGTITGHDANLNDVSANHMNLSGTIHGQNANLNNVSLNGYLDISDGSLAIVGEHSEDSIVTIRKNEDGVLFNRIIIRRMSNRAIINLRELQLWTRVGVNTSYIDINILPSTTSDSLDISGNSLENTTEFFNNDTNLTEQSDISADHISNDLLVDDSAISLGDNASLYIPMNTTINSNHIESIVLYNSTTNPERAIGLRIELYNQTNLLAYTNTITSSENVYRFNFPAISSYSKGFVTEDSSQNITSSALISSDITYTRSGLKIENAGLNVENGNVAIGGFELTLGTYDQVSRGNSGYSRALVKGPNNSLSINHKGDFIGGTHIESNTTITGTLDVSGDVNVEGSLTTNNTTIDGNLGVTGNTTIDSVATFDGTGERIVFKAGGYNSQQIEMRTNGLVNNSASLSIRGKGNSTNIVEFNNWGGHRISFFGFADQGDGTADNVSIHAAKIIKTNASFSPSSDDRIKKNEKFITNAIQTLAKLRPQIYNKYSNLDCSGDYVVESGLIAQEIYYNVPELRHLVNVPMDADISGHINTSDDPSIDPDYSNWGSSIAGVNYDGFVAYLIKAIQEQQEIINEEKEKNQTQYTDLLTRIQALESAT